MPWAFRSVKGDYVGFEIDIGKKLAEDMGVEYRNIPTPGDGIIPGLLAGKFDIILGGMTPTPKRALSVSFSNSYSPALSVGFSVNRKLAAGLSKIEDFNKPNVKIVSRRVCGRPLQCKQEFEQLVTCGQVLSYVRPLKCGMHAPRAHMVFVDRIQIASAVCLTALRAVLVFPTPSL